MPVTNLPAHLNEEFEFYLAKIHESQPGVKNQEAFSRAWKLINMRYKQNKQGEWNIIDTMASSLDPEEFYKLRYEAEYDPVFFLAEANEAKKRFNAAPHQFYLEGAAELIEKPHDDDKLKEILAAKDLKNERPDNFLLFKNVLCTSYPYVNANGAAFRPEDLEAAVSGGQLKPTRPGIVDWLHDFQPYGMTYDCELVKTKVPVKMGGETKEMDVSQIVVYSVFLSWLYPEQSAAMRQWYRDKKLGFSMACTAKSRDYVEESDRYFYYVSGPEFLANSVIPLAKSKPADSNALPQDMAGDKENKKVTVISNADFEDVKPNKGEDKMEIKELQAKVEELTAALNKKDEEIKTLQDKLGKSEVADLQKEREGLQAQLEESKTALTAAQEKVGELEGKLTEAEKAQKELQEKYDKTVADLVDARKSEVDRINAERKDEIANIPGQTEESAEAWMEDYAAEVNDDGTINNKAEAYEKFLNRMPKAETKPEEDPTEKADEKPKDAPKSDLVDESKETANVPTKTDPDGDKKGKAIVV